MAMLKALLVCMTLLTSVLSLPLSNDGSAQVSCFASDLSAPTYDLTTAVYRFCSESFPTDSIGEMTAASEQIKLDSGKTACLTTVLDPIVPDWTSGDCIYLLLKTVADCEVDGGVSTGGEFNPIETGASQFTVKVVESSDPAEAAAGATPDDSSPLGTSVIKRVDDEHSDHVTCYSSDPAVSSNDLVAFVYDFCASNTPDTSSEDTFTAFKDFSLSSGFSAHIAMHLDTAAVKNWIPGDCEYYTLKTITMCEPSPGHSTGGQNDPENSDSQFSVMILKPEAPSDVSPSVITVEGSLAARQTSAEAYCFGHSMGDGDLALPITWAMQAVVDFCEKYDGEIMAQESVRQYTIQFIQPNVWIAVRARRTNTLWDAGCRRSFDVILNACHAEDWHFFGGQHQDDLRIYTMGVQNPAAASAITRRDDQDATNTVSSAEIATESTLPSGLDDHCYWDGEFSAPLLWAIGAVQGFCQVYDGVIMKENNIHQYVFDSVVPHVWVSIRALRSNTLWDEGCRRVYETILDACYPRDGTWTFWGGQHTDEFNLYSIGIDPPATSNGTVGNSTLTSRSPDEEVAVSFNSTESTHAKFTTSCSKFPWSENPISIDYNTAQAVVDYLCFSYSNRPLSKGEQAPLAFTDTDPKLFTNVVAFESVVLYPGNCDWAYDTLFKACVWDGRFYGGEVVVDPVKWVLDFGPGGLAEKTVDAGVTDGTLNPTKLAPRDEAQSLDTMNVQYTTACNNFPWVEGSMSIDFETASKAVEYFCLGITEKPLAEGDQAPLTFQGTDPQLFANAIAMETVVLYPEDCNFAYDTLFKACVWDGRFYGGEIVAEPIKWVLEFPPAALAKTTIDSGVNGPVLAPSAITPRDSDKREIAAPVDCDTNDVSADAFATYQRARDFCDDIGATTWQAGDGTTHLYEDISPWISARAVALDTVNINPVLCYTAFQTLINSCTTDFKYGGGKIDADGMRWTFTVVPGSPPADSKNADIATRSNPYEGSIDCVKDSETSVFWPNAFSASITFCRSVDGEIVTPGSPWHDVWELQESGGTWVTNDFEATDKQVTMDYQTCIEMYDATIRKCKDDDGQTFGGTNEWNGLKAEYKAVDWSDSALARRDSSDSNCIRAESSPIDKQAAGEAISLFCPEFSSHMIAAGDFVTKAILVDGYNIGMRVTAISDDGYMLYAQWCIAGFEQLLTECSDGAEDENTVGGTLFAGDAAFTLSMVFV